jgi:hypothetical protein
VESLWADEEPPPDAPPCDGPVASVLHAVAKRPAVRIANRARVTFELSTDMEHLQRMSGGRNREGAECCLDCCLLTNAWDRAESAHGCLSLGERRRDYPLLPDVAPVGDGEGEAQVRNARAGGVKSASRDDARRER